MIRKAKGAVLRLLAVRRNVSTGERFRVGPRSVIWAPNRLDIGRDVYVGKNVTIEVDGTIGDGVLIANNVGIVGRTDHDIHDIGTVIRQSRWVGDHADLSRPVVIGADVWIGFGAIVLSGVRIGDSAIIGAGSVVNRDVPPNSVAVGNPARVIGQRFTNAEFQQHCLSLRGQGTRIEDVRGA